MRLPRPSARTSLLEWTITDPETLLPGDKPIYPDLEKLIEFVIRVVWAGREYEMICAGFKYDRHFVWDVGHQRAVSVHHILRWRYKLGGRAPTTSEMKGLLEQGKKAEKES